MEITKHIKNILLHKDFIIIPQLGGFVSEYISAAISIDKTVITPPSKKIIFKNTLVHDDGELRKYLEKTMKKSSSEVNFIIQNDVKKIKALLSEGKEVECKGLGYLYLDNNTIQFRFGIKDNLLLDTYGMTSLKVNPVKKKEPEPNTITITNSNTKSNNNINDDMGTKKNKTLIWVVSAAVIIGAALLIIPHTTPYLQDLKVDFANLKDKLFKKGSSDTYASLDDTSKIAKDLDAQMQKQDALYYGEDKSQNITDKNGIPDSLISKYASYSKFYIIAGSYKHYSHAAKLRNQLFADGFNPEILISTEKKLYRVSYVSFTDRRLAIKELYKLQKEKNNKDIWILNI